MVCMSFPVSMAAGRVDDALIDGEEDLGSDRWLSSCVWYWLRVKRVTCSESCLSRVLGHALLF